MPAAATVIVHRQDVSLAMLPGVTGRQDVFARRRAQVLAALSTALDRCREPGSTVTVVAPALLSRTTTTAAPDLGACGYAEPVPPTEPACPAEPAVPAKDIDSDAIDSAEATIPRGGAELAHPAETPLHVTASAAVQLLRLAGWSAPITTHEVGAGSAVTARTLLDPGVPAGAHLVLFSCATPDGTLPPGAHPILTAAELATHALHAEVVALAATRSVVS